MNLYDIDTQLESLIDPETGELLDIEAFEQLQIAREQKVEGMALWYKNMVAEAEAIKKEVDALKDRQQKLQKKADRLKGYIGLVLNGEKFSTPRCAITFRATKSLDVSDADGLTEWAKKTGNEYILRYKAPEINKTIVTNMLKEGVDVPFVSISERNSVSIK